ncbi:ISNCY family transposase [Salmonella enterica]|uniref:ISNCY family transposase n=1 Tax=Salmonella enterica TaxID=28901 RepID=UPI0009735EE9|nr:ISNCY family transposase [Salmonella enterica]APY60989.1 transposase [Salmonella enterica subsp. enterica serovar Hillingdon str. N1529-D3]EBZ6492272.1 ISNCY family transposase [Salmonella enterica subsp. enterica serovar Dugbe]EHV4628748.1 ISNCY family transposase [Salmonella enterica]
MFKEAVTMSHKELNRLQIIQETVCRNITQEQAAARTGGSVRQIKRLVHRYRTEGAEGLISRRRGKRPNNAFSAQFRTHVISLLKERYRDFGPTLAGEKLHEEHGLSLSTETLRKWMIAENLWREKRRKTARIHQRRQRRPCYGELIQIDGSPHHWFEDRGPRCTLIVFIDDATSALMGLRFAPAETTQAYMETLGKYVTQHGIPLALYSDKHSIFRVNNPDREGELTQFTRAIKTLGIEPIHANTPQAKGRVERANQTLQDRLVKELRLQNISDIASANAWLPEFITAYNKRFAIQPADTENAHQALRHSAEELDFILSYQSSRILSKNLTFQYKSSEYQLKNVGHGYRLRHATVTVCEAFDGRLSILNDGKLLEWEKYIDGPPPLPLDDEKSVHERVDNLRHSLKSKYYVKPAADHPWQSRRARERAKSSQSKRDE